MRFTLSNSSSNFSIEGTSINGGLREAPGHLGFRLIARSIPALNEDACPLAQFSLITTVTAGYRERNGSIEEAYAPSTTIIGLSLASVATLTARSTRVSPCCASSCFGVPNLAEPPAARITAAMRERSGFCRNLARWRRVERRS